MSITAEELEEVGFDADMVERRARIFRFGHFPGKGDGGWTCTREDFIAFNGESGVVPIGLDPIGRKHYHGRTSVLEGRTGEAHFAVEGDEVYATLRAPGLVIESAVEHGLKLSSVFRSATDKTLTKVDLVDTPHFEDAIIFARESGEVMVLEDDEPDEPEEVEFASAPGHEAYQTMHDCCSHGRPGLCEPKGKVGFARDKKETEDDKLLRQMHHHAVHMGAYCPGMPDGMDHEEIAMSEDLEDEVETPEGEEQPQEVSFTREEFLAMRAEMARLRTDNVRDKAVAFTKEVTTGENARATTQTQKKAIEEGYARAAEMDAMHPEPVAFTADDGSLKGAQVKGTHVEAFKALVLGFPKLGIVRPKVSGKATEVDFALDMEPAEGAESQKREDERREERRKLNRAALGKMATPD